jgi:vitamin B12 transporter
MTKKIIFLFIITQQFSANANVTDDYGTIYVKSAKEKTSTSDVASFDRKAIEDSGAVSLRDLLHRVPGIQLQRTGGAGQLTTINMRGTDNRHTLVLVDGVRQEDVTSIDGSSRLEFLSLDNIEKLEVIKGSQGVLYGSSAIGGVINITTKKNNSSFVKARLGSFKHRSLSGMLGRKFNNLSTSLNFNISEEDGFSSQRPVAGDLSDNDGYKALAGQLNIAYVSDRLDVKAWVKLDNHDYEYDSEFGDEFGDSGSYNSKDYGTQVSYQFSDKTSLESLIAFGDVTRELISIDNNSKLSLPFEGSRLRAEQSLAIDYSLGSFVMGWEASEERADALGSQLSDKLKLHRAGVFINSIYDVKKVISVSSGVRFEKMQRAGERFTYQVGGLIPFYKLKARLNYTTGFKAPTLYHYFASLGSNQNLKPETSQSFDTSLEYEEDKYLLKLSYFATNYDNYIDYYNNPLDFRLSHYVNIKGARIKGFEFSYKHEVSDRVEFSLDHTLMQTLNQSSGRYLVRRPRHQSSGEVTIKMPWSLSTSLLYQYMGRRDAINGVLPSYSLMDLTFKKNIGLKSKLLIKLNNILDKDYEEIRGYLTPSRNVMVSYQRSL